MEDKIWILLNKLNPSYVNPFSVLLRVFLTNRIKFKTDSYSRCKDLKALSHPQDPYTVMYCSRNLSIPVRTYPWASIVSVYPQRE